MEYEMLFVKYLEILKKNIIKHNNFYSFDLVWLAVYNF